MKVYKLEVGGEWRLKDFGLRVYSKEWRFSVRIENGGYRFKKIFKLIIFLFYFNRLLFLFWGCFYNILSCYYLYSWSGLITGLTLGT